MLANGVKQTTSTTGTGALTLAAVDGAPTVAQAVPVGFPVAYALIKAGALVEAGIGYLSNATTFVRAKVHATMVGGVYNKANPGLANLTGTHDLILTPLASTLESMMPGVDPTAPNRLLTSAARNFNTTAAGPGTGTAYYMPFLHRYGGRILSLAVNVTTVQPAATAQIGLYACLENGQPGPLIVKSTDLDLSVLGLRTFALAEPLSLPPGWYYTGYVGSNGSVRVTGYTSTLSNLIGPTPLGLNAALVPIEVRMEGLGSVVLPATPTPNSSGNAGGATLPLVYLGAE